MGLKVLIKRDTSENFKVENFIPREFELVAAYNENSEDVIYKLGDGKTPWTDLPEITKISDLDKFNVYCINGDKAEVFLNPFIIKETLDSLYCETEKLSTEELIDNV